MDNLAGRTAVITGAASGIGLALTERFVAAGLASHRHETKLGMVA